MIMMKKMLPLVLAMASARGASLAELERMIARFAPAEMRVDTAALSAGDRKALVKLIEASRVIDDLFLTQMWSGNHARLAKLEKDTTALGKARLHYFHIQKSPWSELDGHAAFLPGVPPKKLAGANFYPPDMTKEEFESWVKKLPGKANGSRRRASSRSSAARLRETPAHGAIQRGVPAGPGARGGAAARDAAAATENETLKRFLTLRADAFLSNDYYASDLAWMDLDAPLDVTIGPYETYNDEIFGYKAAFEAYVNLRDEQETAKLKFFADALAGDREQPAHRAAITAIPKLGALAPIRVVNEIFAAGDGESRSADRGVQPAQRRARGAGKGQQARDAEKRAGGEIPKRAGAHCRSACSRQAAQNDLSFDSFFTHILAHETDATASGRTRSKSPGAAPRRARN